MPKSSPKYTASTMMQAGQAALALVRCLVDDPRVQRAYAAWRERHGLRPDDALTVAAFDSMKRDDVHDLVLIDRLIRDELTLPYTRLARLVRYYWGTSIVPGPDIALEPDDIGLPRGRAAKNEGAHLARDVEWFYRHRVRGDTVYALAKEEQTRRRDAGEPAAALSVGKVQQGIRRAKRLLDVFADLPE